MAVDTALDQKPSGRAAQLAQERSAEHSLKFIASWFCPYVQRSWMTLQELNIPHQYIEINPYLKTKEFLKMNPRGLVPCLIIPEDEATLNGHRPLYESIVICEFLEEAFRGGHGFSGEVGGLLMPPRYHAYIRARCRLWINHIDTKIVPAFYRFLQHTPEKDYTLESARENFHKQLLAFAQEMIDGAGDDYGEGPWFLGGRFSMVDIMLAPWAKRLFILDHYKEGGAGIPAPGKGGKDEVAWARWRSWCDAALARESLLQTSSEDSMYLKAYKRYADDTTQSEVGQATRNGTRLP